MSSDVVSSLIVAAFDTVSDESRWSTFLSALAEALGASTISIFSTDVASLRSRIAFEVGKDQSFVRAYNEYFSRVNPFMADLGEHRWSPGTIELADRVCPEPLLLQTEYYNDWLRPQKLHHLARGVIGRVGDAHWAVSFGRPRNAGRFSERELRILAAVLPKLRNVLRVRQHLVDARTQQDTAAAMLNSLRIGVVLLDVHDRPLHVNTRARSILDSADGLRLERDGLHAAHPADTGRLQRLIAETRMATDAVPCGGDESLLIRRPSGRVPLSVVVTAVPPAQLRDGKGMALTAVFITDPEDELRTCAQHLAVAYGLTPAEHEIVDRILRGLSLRQIAEQRGVSVETVRTQVKIVFAKTGTRRQADIVRLARGGSPLVHPAPVEQSHPSAGSRRSA